MSGDPSQFPPLGNSFRGQKVPDTALATSQFLHGLAGGRRLRLTQCRRSEINLFETYMWVSAERSRPIEELVAHCRAKFPCRGDCEHNLVVSHRRRIQINREHNSRDRLLHPDAISIRRVPTPGATMKSQDMWVFPQQVLIACVGMACKGLRNGVRYTVVEATREHISLDNGVKLTLVDASRFLRLGYAQTLASCQGDEFPSVVLHDADHPRFTWRHLYVGMSRGRVAYIK